MVVAFLDFLHTFEETLPFKNDLFSDVGEMNESLGPVALRVHMSHFNGHKFVQAILPKL